MKVYTRGAVNVTSFKALFKVMSRGRFRLMNWVILAELAVIAATLLWGFASDGIEHGDTFWVTLAWSMVAFTVAFILLSVRMERVYTRDTYRLLPLGETKLYLTDLLSSVVMFVYFGIIQCGLYLITEAIDNRYLMTLLQAVGGPHYTTGQAFKVATGLVALGLALLILGWTTISLVHLVISATNNFLPNTSRRLINVILYVIVILLVIRITGFLFHEVNNLGQLIAGGVTAQFMINIGGALVIAAIEAVLNIVLLKKWVETIPN